MREGMIDGVKTVQEITGTDLWSDLSKWTPLTPFYWCTYVLKVTDLCKYDPEPARYYIAEWNEHKSEFFLLYGIDRSIKPFSIQKVEWKVIV